MTTVKESFVHCRRVARRRARNFYYSFLLLPPEKRKAMCAIYAFMRRSDDITDATEPSIEARRAQLSRWRDTVADGLQGRYGGDPILPALHQTVMNYRIPKEYLFDLLEGVGSDLQSIRFRTFEELYRYCYRVASVVGLTTLHIFGFESAQAFPLAEKCGVAFQLTNILRDIPEDAQRGRMYLPEEDLERFGISSDEIIHAHPGPRFRELMQFEWIRANDYYQQATPLLRLVRPESRAAFWAMISIYRGILDRIRSLRYDVYRNRPRLSGVEKAAILLRALKWRFNPRLAPAAAPSGGDSS